MTVDAASLRCPTCLATLRRDTLVLPCPGTCRHGDRGEQRFERRVFGDHGSRPRQQAWRCRRADDGCMEVLTQVRPAGCLEPLSHPVGMPAARLRHEVLIALDRRSTTLHAGLACLASAVSSPRARLRHSVMGPMTPETWRIWRDTRSAAHSLPLPAARSDVRSPLVFGLPPGIDDWGYRLHLHGWTRDRPAPAGPADRPCAAPMEERLLRADRLVLLVPAADAMDRQGRERLTKETGTLVADLQRAGADGVLKICLCLLDQEVLFRRLGSGAVHPRELAALNWTPDRIVKHIQHVVSHSTRLGELGDRLLQSRVAESVVYAAAGFDECCVGLAPWAAAIDAFLERAS